MTAADPLEGLRDDLDYERVSAETATIALPAGDELPVDDAGLRLLVYAAVFDMLAEACCRTAANDDERVARLFRAMALVRSVEPTLRFALFEKAGLAERQELTARMRGKEIALTEEWMIPRLREDMAAYRARVDALRAALEGMRA